MGNRTGKFSVPKSTAAEAGEVATGEATIGKTEPQPIDVTGEGAAPAQTSEAAPTETANGEVKSDANGSATEPAKDETEEAAAAISENTDEITAEQGTSEPAAEQKKKRKLMPAWATKLTKTISHKSKKAPAKTETEEAADATEVGEAAAEEATDATKKEEPAASEEHAKCNGNGKAAEDKPAEGVKPEEKSEEAPSVPETAPPVEASA